MLVAMWHLRGVSDGTFAPQPLCGVIPYTPYIKRTLPCRNLGGCPPVAWKIKSATYAPEP